MRGWIVVAALLGVLAAPAQGALRLANRCVRLGSQRVFVKPTRLGAAMLYDRDGRLLGDGLRPVSGPGPAAEWRIGRPVRDRVRIRSAAGVARTVTVRRATGCRPYPEAGVNATGRPLRHGLRGWADAHLHIPANLRAGGEVVSGEPFDPFGVTEALGRDAQVHGPGGALDVTGNLLRSGNPVGTHDTAGWPTFAGWPTAGTYTHQQVYYRWLQRAWAAGLRLVVAQTVEDEPLCRIEPRTTHSCDETATIDLEVAQLRALQDYVDAQEGGRGRGWLRLVEGPAQAARAIRAGKLAVLIGVESSDPFGCSEYLGLPRCDRAQIDAGIAHLRAIGVRGTFLAHWVDNALTGAAIEPGAKGTFISALQVEQTGLPFATGPCPFAEQGTSCNARGLTDLGRYAVQRLMDAHMIVEVDHLSEVAREQVLALAEQRHYPLVSSHTGTGGIWTTGELRRLYALGGFATTRLDDAAKLPQRVLALRDLQPGAGVGVAVGTDTGGFNALPSAADLAGRPPLSYPYRAFYCDVRLGRERTGSRTFDLNTDGVAHYGLLPDLLADLGRGRQGHLAVRQLFRSAAGYLSMWRRTGSR